MSRFVTPGRRLCSAAPSAAAAAAPAATAASGGRWERLRSSKAGVWFRSLVSDYKEACREIVVGVRERPLKAAAYAALLGGAWACLETKPDWTSFEAALLQRSNQLGLLSPWIRSAASDRHVHNLVRLRNEGRLRHLSLGLLALVYHADFDADATLYEAQCSHLSVAWTELPGRVLDVGFAGRWWILDSKMKDFDVNEDEFKHLPAHMQTTLPPTAQEVERNERLHKESWLALEPVEEAEEEAEEEAGRRELANDGNNPQKN